MPKSNTDNFLKNFTIIIMIVGFVSTFFIGANTILAQKVDKEVYNRDKTNNYKQHESILLKLNSHDKVIAKLELMADIYLKQNRK